ncbi:gp54 protein [Mycobacteroides abscessus subsp. massiliense]|nr:gp54 protein [Mycobacteroides abscessus subsp. massiliense]SKM99315.1 gp54 protein [Mycobacteroides abscessus subsp. massiliense]SKN77896.1 gp54 protein [Mycobacteroides abscessus subsp. massiliense]SKN95337.1 gp54 protein [Mycobacteroides abscessus subsp. massiliense]SKO23106.1 gp54 protein [Mycobacteroides abscessus subsp. massiliense]
MWLVGGERDMARIIQRPELPRLLADLVGDHTIAAAAYMLSLVPPITVGRDQLFEAMASEEWIFRGRDHRWIAYEEAVDLGYLKLYPGGEYLTPTGETKERPKQIHLTPKGIGEMYYRLGGTGTGQLAFDTTI